ncbi:MAG: peptidoglycan DD-metalloendopeptidase family protein [Pseudomonadota bacterium]|jgi:murein DD-endopeptidase MepM/ murein hydrolase activator NlpD
MSSVAEFHYSRRAPQVAALALISVAFAGCSADTQSRFSQSNFSNPFRSETTASVPQQQAPQAAPYGRVDRGPQVSSQPLPPPVSAPQSYPSYPQQGGVSGGGRGLSSYTPPSAPIESTGTVAPRSVAAVKPSQVAGTTIIVGTSDTLEGLSKRYNVSSAAILQANGYRGPRALQPGQQLIIPRATAPAPAAPAAIAAAPASSASSTHVVNRGETLMSLSRRYNVPLSQLAKANNLTTTSQLAIGSKVVVPGGKPAPAIAVAQPAAEQKPAQVVAQAPQTKPAMPEPQQKARLASATPDVPESAPAKATETTSALPAFRWPARGRVIAGYGAKTNGKQNDGINVAVPEGTPVKAAEDGVVAYSGNELKDYGNLVLVRHANGYVTAYAHASELMVKRGDTIKRGQIIAKSGQTGGVSSPQLHFEIRKGSSPVDPMQFLNGT